MTTQCAVHPEIPAIQACDRCGTFGCGQCLGFMGDQRLCAACVARQGVGLPSLHGRAQWAKGGLYAMGAMHLSGGLIRAGFDTSEATAGAGAILLGLWGLASIPLLVLTIVWFCRWFHLSVRWATQRGVFMAQTPASAVGSWFIPFLNLVRPYDLMRQMLSGTGGNPKLVSPWQALWLIGNGMSNLSSRFDNGLLSILAGALLLGAGLTGVAVINDYTRSATAAAPASVGL